MSALKQEQEYIHDEYEVPELEEHIESEEDGNDELWLLSYADLMTLLMAFFALLLSFSKFDLEKFERMKEKASEQFGGEYTKPHQELQQDLKQVIAKNNLEGLVKIEEHPLGVILSFQGNILFDSGAVEFREENRRVIARVISIIKKEARNYNIIIEGHTDDAPMSAGRLKSNWELSAVRASTLARAFGKFGFKKKQIKVTGFADSVPLVPNRNERGDPIPENRAKNRRVVMKVLNLEGSNEQGI